MEFNSGGTPGPCFDAVLSELDNNVYGFIDGDWTPLQLAQIFVREGWRARKTARDEYEIENTWTQINLERRSSGDSTVFTGVVDPNRFTLLADTLANYGVSGQIELYDDKKALIQELPIKKTNTHVE